MDLCNRISGFGGSYSPLLQASCGERVDQKQIVSEWRNYWALDEQRDATLMHYIVRPQFALAQIDLSTVDRGISREGLLLREAVTRWQCSLPYLDKMYNLAETTTPLTNRLLGLGLWNAHI